MDAPAEPSHSAAATVTRFVIVVDGQLSSGLAANAAAVIALTVGARHPDLVGGPLVDASKVTHPGLIPIGIAVLSAEQAQLSGLRFSALEAGCDVVDFPTQGQQTKNYQAFQDAVREVSTEELRYVGIGLIGQRKTVNKIVASLGLLK